MGRGGNTQNSPTNAISEKVIVTDNSSALLFPNPMHLQKDSQLFLNIPRDTPWLRMKHLSGNFLPRRSCWFTVHGCTCNYNYANTSWHSNNFPSWLQDLTNTVSDFLISAGYNFPTLNSCNANLYEHGYDSIGWHSDDEVLFREGGKSYAIISLSLGASRDFLIRRKGGCGLQFIRKTLHNGDLLIMDGQFQYQFEHSLPKSRDSETGQRINLTWRTVVNHDRACRHH